MKITTNKCSFCDKSEEELSMLIANSVGTAYICDRCVEVCNQIISNRETQNLIRAKQKPKDIKNYLDKFIIEQESAKKIISVAVYNHYKRLNYNYNNAKNKVEIEKSNILLLGPTGSGKTLIARTLAKFLDVPFAEADATTLTEAGYVGEDVESVLQKLLQASGYDTKKAEKGIIYIDEIDKISKRAVSRNLPRDPSGEGVQQALLKLLEGSIVNVPIGAKRFPAQETVQLNTRNILFICGGAFIGLDKIVSERKRNKNLGFLNNSDAFVVSDYVTPADLMTFGMIPEFIGRLPVIAELKELTKDQLVRVLNEPENNLVSQYKELFKMEGIDIEFTQDALVRIAEEAYSLKAGARGLKNIMETLLLDIMFETPDCKQISSLLIDKNFVVDKKRNNILIANNVS